MRYPLLILLLTACSSKVAVPKDVLPPAKMQTLLYDVIRVDELVDFSSMQDSLYRVFSKRTGLYDSVFRIHAVTKEGFQKSLDFYQQHPDLLKNIFDSLQKKTDTTSPPKIIPVS